MSLCSCVCTRLLGSSAYSGRMWIKVVCVEFVYNLYSMMLAIIVTCITVVLYKFTVFSFFFFFFFLPQRPTDFHTYSTSGGHLPPPPQRGGGVEGSGYLLETPSFPFLPVDKQPAKNRKTVNINTTNNESPAGVN